MLTALFVGIIAVTVTYLALFTTTRKAHSSGVLLPTTGVIRVLPLSGGIITASEVKEGQAVRTGQILFVVSGERSNASTASTEKAVSATLRTRLDSFTADLQHSQIQSRQRLDATLRRADELRDEIRRVDEQLQIQKQRVQLAQQVYERYSGLQAKNYVSEALLQEKQVDLLEQRQRTVDLERTKGSKERELMDAQAAAADLQIQAQLELNALRRGASALEQDLAENEARREFVVRAPQDGVITAITAEVGQTVRAESVMASLLPQGAELEAEIYVPSRSVGFLKPGMRVTLRYQAYPYQKFGQHQAHVREVALTSLRPEELSLPGVTLPPGVTSEPLYRIRLTLAQQSIRAYGQSMPLKSGMVVDASIALDHRRLYEWMLDPLFSISGRL